MLRDRNGSCFHGKGNAHFFFRRLSAKNLFFFLETDCFPSKVFKLDKQICLEINQQLCRYDLNMFMHPMYSAIQGIVRKIIMSIIGGTRECLGNREILFSQLKVTRPPLSYLTASFLQKHATWQNRWWQHSHIRMALPVCYALIIIIWWVCLCFGHSGTTLGLIIENVLFSFTLKNIVVVIFIHHVYDVVRTSQLRFLWTVSN